MVPGMIRGRGVGIPGFQGESRKSRRASGSPQGGGGPQAGFVEEQATPDERGDEVEGPVGAGGPPIRTWAQVAPRPSRRRGRPSSPARAARAGGRLHSTGAGRASMAAGARAATPCGRRCRVASSPPGRPSGPGTGTGGGGGGDGIGPISVDFRAIQGRPPRDGGGARQLPNRMIPKAVPRVRVAVVLLRVTKKITSGVAVAVPSIVTEKVLVVSPAAKVSSSVFAR